MLFYLYALTAIPLIGAIFVLLTTGYWNVYLYILVGLLGGILVLITPGYWKIPVGFLWLIFLALTSPDQSSTKHKAPVVIRLNLTPEVMRACAEALTRYGLLDVQDYECQVEKDSKGVVVALYSSMENGKVGEKKRLGEVPLGGGDRNE